MSWDHLWHPLLSSHKLDTVRMEAALSPQEPGEIPVENCSWVGSSCLCSALEWPWPDSLSMYLGSFQPLLGWVGGELCPHWHGTGWTICSAAGGAETWLFFAKHTE